MANIVMNIGKGRVAYYATLPGAADALIAVPLEATGLEADATLRDYDDLAALLAGTSNEQVTMGRKTLTAVTVTVDDTGEAVNVDAADLVWAAATGNGTGKLLICYDADTAAGTDANVIPLVALDFVTTPDGSDITAAFDAAGFYGAT